MKETSRFQCDNKNGNCQRILNREGRDSFPCSVCGHGRMRIVKPRAYCEQCKKPVYENIDLHPDEKSKAGYYLICDDCTVARTTGVKDIEGRLHTNFKSIEDAGEKIAYYNTKTEEAKGLNVSSAKIKVKSFGDRLKEIRRKLGLTQTQLAKHFKMKSKSTVLRYEKSERKLPENIKEWIRFAESTFRHFERKEGEEKVMEKLLNVNEPKKAVKPEKRANHLGESSQFLGGYVG